MNAVMAPTDLVFDEAELYAITRYSMPCKQLAELHRQGFYRARIGRVGGVILERAHYEAVCAGKQVAKAPKVRPPKLRSA